MINPYGGDGYSPYAIGNTSVDAYGGMSGEDPYQLDTASTAPMAEGSAGNGYGFGKGLGVVGGLMQGAGAYIKGQNTASALEYSAKLQGMNAQQALWAAKVNADKSQLLAQRMLGSVSAGYAASGVDLDSGSVAAVMGASAANAEWDRQNILYGGQLRAIQYENQKQLDEVQAGEAKTAGDIGAVGGVVSAISTIAMLA